MSKNFEIPASLTTAKKTSMAIAGIMTSIIMTTVTANAAPEVLLNQSSTGSTTVVEQYSDGQVTTIRATPTGISMQNGMPYSVTQITSAPRYVISQAALNQTSINKNSTTVTNLPVINQISNGKINTVTTVDVITTPVNTATQVMLPVITSPVTANIATLTNQADSNQIIATTSLDTLQLKPTFSTPDIINARTKIMKILKNSSGNEVAVPANHIAPGDTIEYHTIYTNTTARPVNNVNAMVALPTGIKLVSLNSTLPTLATTGGNQYQTIDLAGNTAVIQESYSGLKWNLVDLASNATQTVVIRAKVQ